MNSKDDFLKKVTVPTRDVNKSRLKVFVIRLIQMIITGASTFFIPLITESFKRGLMSVGVVLLFVLLWQNVIAEVITKRYQNALQNLSIKVSKYSLDCTMNIAKKVEGKVYLNDGVERRVTTYEVVNNLRDYITNTFSFRDEVIENIIYLVVFIATIAGSIYTTLKMTSGGFLFIMLLAVGVIILVRISLEQFKQRKEYAVLETKLNNRLRNLEDDYVNSYAQNLKHQDYLSERYKETTIQTLVEGWKITMKEADSYIKRAFVMTFVLSSVVCVALFNEVQITYEVGISILAVTNMYMNIVMYILEYVRKLQKLSERYAKRDSFSKIVDLVASKYVEIFEYEKHAIEDARIDSFSIEKTSFAHKDEDGKSHHTIVIENLFFASGSTTLICGASGAGKTTLVNVITGFYASNSKIIANGGKLILNHLQRFLMYKEGGSELGSGTLLEEVLTQSDTSTFDEARLIEILKGVMLYDSILEKVKGTGKSVIDFLKENYKDKASTGEYKRYALTRFLYNMSENDDILILDEPIGNLDEENAMRVIEFIKEFANRDRNRIVIIISHQVSITKGFCDQVITVVKDGGNVFRFVKE